MWGQIDQVVHFLGSFVSFMQLNLQMSGEDRIFTQTIFPIFKFTKSDQELLPVFISRRRQLYKPKELIWKISRETFKDLVRLWFTEAYIVVFISTHREMFLHCSRFMCFLWMRYLSLSRGYCSVLHFNLDLLFLFLLTES